MTGHVKVTRTGGVLEILLDRPEKKNALTEAMYGAMADAIEAAAADARIRAILFAGEGDIFTAGNDVGDFAQSDARKGTANVGRFLTAIAHSPLPLIAAVQGRAVGVGTTMLLHCDQVLLAEGAVLSTPFVNLALVPEAGSSLLMPLRIGHARAFAAFVLGDPISALDAVAWGLANRIVPAEDLRASASMIADRISRQPKAAILATKALMKRTLAIADQIEAESSEFTARLASPEAKEAFAAFAERRPANFSQFD